MTWTLTLAAFAMASGLSQGPAPGDDASKPTPRSASEVQPDSLRQAPWLATVRAMGPVTTTDPQRLAVAAGLAHSGAYRASVQYQPREAGRLGMIHTALGVRVLNREMWQLAFDLEHSQARPVRRLFRGSGWQLDGHERHQLSIGVASLQWRKRTLAGLVSSVEVGAGQMHIWRLVSARAGSGALSSSPDPILESAATVGILGLRAGHRLFFGFEGQAHVRLIGAGRSRGGEVPFAHLTAEWDVTHPIFQSQKFGHAFVGLTGNHATSPRAVSYFQNGLGLTFRLVF